jgi:hypothetical protein
MKHRLALVLLAVIAGAILASGAAANHGRHHGRIVHARAQSTRNELYSFSGTLLAAPGANASSVSLQVTTGNKAGLRAMLGASQNEVFDLGSSTEVLLWSNGVPHVGSSADLQSGQYVTVNVRAARGSSLSQIESTDAGTVSQHGAPGANLPLYLYVGTVSGPQSGGKVNLAVTNGDRRALHLLVGQPTAQSFTYDDSTIFLLWQGKVPTVIDPSQLKAGDRITVRIRAAAGSSLAQVEATSAVHVGDHEPGAV